MDGMYFLNYNSIFKTVFLNVEIWFGDEDA